MRTLIVGLLLLTACAQSTTGGPTGSQRAPEQGAAPSVPQRALTMAIQREPASLDASFINGANNGDYVALSSAFLAYLTPEQQPKPYLAESLPTLENGAWKILPDGTMETTYKLNKNAKWQDGRVISAGDFVFGYQARTDPTVPVFSAEVENRLDIVQAHDDHTLFMHWREPYLWAGAVHSTSFAPWPRHLLESMYLEDKDQFNNSPFWRDQYIGSGPYKIVRWEPGAEIVYRAHDGFVLGKPSIDELRVKFITDPTTVVANMLSGDVDVAFFAAIGYPQNLALEQAGFTGKVEYWRGQNRFLEFQQRDWGNLQKAVLEPKVRKAVLHAIDRKGLVEGIYSGRAPTVHFWLDRSDPAFPAADAVVSKYELDLTRSAALLQEVGWTRGADGMMRNAAGELLNLPVLAQTGDVENLESAVLIDGWKSAGISSELIALTPQLSRDTEFRSKYPAMAYNRRGFGMEDMVWMKENLTLPERRWAGDNRNGYVNPRLEELWVKALGTVDVKQREPILVEALKVMTDDAVVTPIILQPKAMAYRAGLTGPKESSVEEKALVWNIWEWKWQ